MHSATELQQPTSNQTLQFSIHTIKGYCYATVSLSTDQWKYSMLFYLWNFYLLC